MGVSSRKSMQDLNNISEIINPLPINEALNTLNSHESLINAIYYPPLELHNNSNLVTI